MICSGIRNVQSRLGAGVREWCCVTCLRVFTDIEFDEDGKGILPEHERELTISEKAIPQIALLTTLELQKIHIPLPYVVHRPKKRPIELEEDDED